jgi:hypothetical protein
MIESEIIAPGSVKGVFFTFCEVLTLFLTFNVDNRKYNISYLQIYR